MCDNNIRMIAKDLVLAGDSYRLGKDFFSYKDHKFNATTIKGITADDHDVITGYENYVKTRCSQDPGNTTNMTNATPRPPKKKKKNADQENSKDPHEAKDLPPWPGSWIMDLSINEIKERMKNEPHLPEIIKEAARGYRISRKFLLHKQEATPDRMTPEEINYIDLDLSDGSIAMYIYFYYTIPKRSGSLYFWGPYEDCKTIAKHYQCIQLAMFLDGRGVF